jgi:glycosyltransferase involved in cell wall biosynthesis
VSTAERAGILYLAPWVDYGGSDTSTIDWFRWLDRGRFAPSLITTQPSSNRRLAEVATFAEEIWALPELMEGKEFPQFIAQFIESREIEVVHVMNSRIGFDLLPDLHSLKRRPKIVVQLHVEEPTRDGYVRYVTTRFGNLVDAFSVSSAHVGEAIVGYGVPAERVHAIPTGIDTEHFDPLRTSPRSDLDSGLLHLLYVARLTAQKNPLLMVDVARELAARELPVCIHVIGGGELEPEVRARVAEHGLQGQVRFEAPTHELRPWYASVDALLMTSVFEGVPVIVYEAMSMAVPIVAPDLPGIRELLGGGGGTLIAECSRAAAYADQVEALIADRARGAAMGLEGRAVIERHFSVEQMAARHGELYDQLIEGSRSAPGPSIGWLPPRSRFATRPSRGQPRVSVITPCYNHGRELAQCVESIRAQTYPDIEMIVIDDASEDLDTRAYLDGLEGEPDIEVIRMPRNGGPSVARNRGIAGCTGRFVLPVDADNLLLPDAIERLVVQLLGAGEQIGFIYQNCQYFGNREDYYEPPVYNAWVLTKQNFIDTCALIDREVYDGGLDYAEDIVFGHEDWDFFLKLAAAGVVGEPARGKTLLYRKEGFTRSDLVEWTGTTYHTEQAERHPTLMPKTAGTARPSPQSMRVKAHWAPTVSFVALAPLAVAEPAWRAVWERVARQRCRDFELLVALDSELEEVGGVTIRPLPGRLASSPAEQLERALELARARHVVLTYAALPDLLADPGSVERLLRSLERRGGSVLCLADAREPGAHAFALLGGDDPELEPHTIALADLREIAVPAELDTGDPVGGIARSLLVEGVSIEWRQLAAPWARPAQPSGVFHTCTSPPRPPRPQRAERDLRLAAPANHPAPTAPVPRWSAIASWLPACTAPLVRHRRPGSDEWRVTTSLVSPPGFQPEWYLGIVHLRALEGTARICPDPDRGYTVVPKGSEPNSDEMDESLGYADQVAFALLAPLLVCRHGVSGELVLVCGEDDPLALEVEMPHLDVLGYVDRFPILPHEVATSGGPSAWLRGLLRVKDGSARRHRVKLARAAEADSWEIGALLDRDPGGGIATWIDDAGLMHTTGYSPTRRPFDPRGTLRWVGAPARWAGFSERKARARAVLRRGLEGARHVITRPGIAAPPEAPPPPDAWLLGEPGPGRVAVYSAVHPVTADQLVTRDPSEARELGYGSTRLLGYALARAPATGTLRRPSLGIPWGSRFGEALTHSEDPVGAA